MFKRSSVNLLGASSAFAVALMFIAGCGDKDKSASVASGASDSSTVLCKVDGKAVITETDFNNSVAQMMESNPYFRGAGAQGLPLSIKRRFFDELVKQELIIIDATKNNIEQDPEFKKSLEEMQKLVKRSLLVQVFQKKIYDGLVIEVWVPLHAEDEVGILSERTGVPNSVSGNGSGLLVVQLPTQHLSGGDDRNIEPLGQPLERTGDVGQGLRRTFRLTLFIIHEIYAVHKENIWLELLNLAG